MTSRVSGLRSKCIHGRRPVANTTHMAIRQRAHPAIRERADLVAAAQTGTGKTAAFTVPLVERLSQHDASGTKRRPVRALVIAPTRELAAQIHESVKTYGRNLPLRSGVIFGGVGMQPQIDRLRKGVDILIATPVACWIT